MSSFILIWSERTLALATLLQAWELYQLKNIWSDEGVWQWSTVRKQYVELPKLVLKFLDQTLNEKSFHQLLKFSFCSSVGLWFLPSSLHLPLLMIVFLATWLTAVRWRGIFNGGSDSMTAIVAFCLIFARAFSEYPIVVKIAFAYIAVQLTASYFIAGISKLKNPEWRNATALPIFFNTPRYDSPPELIRKIFQSKTYARIFSYLIILFECSFPIAWVSQTLCVFYLTCAFVFHLLNFWIFGLNRFVFAWFAAYPALYFLVTHRP